MNADNLNDSNKTESHLSIHIESVEAELYKSDTDENLEDVSSRASSPCEIEYLDDFEEELNKHEITDQKSTEDELSKKT